MMLSKKLFAGVLLTVAVFVASCSQGSEPIEKTEVSPASGVEKVVQESRATEPGEGTNRAGIEKPAEVPDQTLVDMQENKMEKVSVSKVESKPSGHLATQPASQPTSQAEIASINEIDGKQLATCKLKIGGMTCGGCAAGVTNALTAANGVKKAKVDFATLLATVEYDPKVCTVEQLVSAVEKKGFEATEQ